MRVQSFEKITTHSDPVEFEEIRKVDEENQQGGRNPDVPFQHRLFSRCHDRTMSFFRLLYPQVHLAILASARVCTEDKRERAKQKR